MNFEITGKLLERTTSLADKLQCEAEILLSEIYRKGLEVMEGVKPAHIRTKAIPAEQVASFIEKNWSVMSDEEMAMKLGLSFLTIRKYRQNMRFIRKKSRSLSGSVSHELVTELSEGEKAEIASRPEYSHHMIAQNMHKPFGMIRSYRLELAKNISSSTLLKNLILMLPKNSVFVLRTAQSFV